MTFTFGVAFLLLNFVIYSLFGALGGILGVAIFQKKTTAINGSGSGVYGHTTGVAFPPRTADRNDDRFCEETGEEMEWPEFVRFLL